MDDEQWIDTTFDPESMQSTKVPFLSDEYFDLADSRPELASAFALGQAVIVVSEGVAYQVVPEGVPTQTFPVPSYTPTPIGHRSNPSEATSSSISRSDTITLAPNPATPLPTNTAPCASILAPSLLLAGYLFQRLQRR